MTLPAKRTRPRRPRKTRPPAEGKLCKCGLRRVNIGFDEDTFAEVRALAVKNGTGFGEAVRQLVQDGIETRAMEGE
jgi:hypothetical protein